MMTNSMTDRICNSCNCNLQEAREYLDDEIRNLRELRELDDFSYSDLEQACANLGLENDCVEYFIGILSVC